MTDELDPQTQQHIDDSADVTADADAVTCDDIDLDDPILDESATAETPGAEDAGEQNDDAPAQDDDPVQDAAPQAAGPIEVSSEEELDAVMDPALYTGRCAQQVERFLSECAPLLADAQSADGAISL